MSIDPITVATGAAAYLGLKDLLPRILGPSADYLGGELRSYTEKGKENLKKIFVKSGEKLGEKLNSPGQVSPKVLKNILEEGYFTEDELAAEYFGGVLASSRTENSRDDRGAAFIKLVSGLSVYQLRLHYVFYSMIRKRHLGTAINLYDQTKRKEHLKIFISDEDFATGLDIRPPEDSYTLVLHTLHGLLRHGLIEERFAHGDPNHLKTSLRFDAPSSGLVMCPSVLGCELYLWAYGKGANLPSDIFDPTIELKPLPGISLPA